MREETFLFPEMDNIHLRNAIDRVKQAYEFSQHLGMGELYVAFSGGKDSVAVYGVCKLAAQELGIDVLDMCEFHYNITTVDPPELIYFLRESFPFVYRDRPKKTMWKLIETRCNMPPTRLVRYCCAELKEVGGEGRFCVTGVRRAESTKRAGRKAFETQDKDISKRIMFNDNEEFRNAIEHCIPKQKYVCNPIIDWEDDDVWDFIHEENLPYCKLYDEGFTRIGCIGCPMAKKEQRIQELERWSGFKKAYIRAFQKMLDRHPGSPNWKTGEDVYDWWINGELATAEQPEKLFED